MYKKMQDIQEKAVEKLDKAMGERMDADLVGILADVVKDMSESIKACSESEYYMAVTDAMEEGSGYEEGYRDSKGRYARRRNQGYGDGYRRNRNRRGYEGYEGYRSGYHSDEVMRDLTEMMDSASPQEREQMRMKLRQMVE